ncbi:MAG: WYL domain-containing protein [Leptospirales bacterium]|jgi:proteasome accessory factor C
MSASDPKSRTPTGRNLRRIFSLVPLIFNNQGLTLKELQKLSGSASMKQLRQDLDRLMMFGVPPFSPSDLITIYIDDESRVTLDFPQGLEHPLALTPAEWATVQKLITRELEFQATTGGAGDEDTLRDILKRISIVPVELETSDTVRTKRTLVQEALASNESGADEEEACQLEFQYRTLSSQEAEVRRLDPWALVKHNGVSYLIGFCHTREAPRFFHLERMEQIELLDLPREHEPPANLQDLLRASPIFQEQPDGFTVELAFAPDLRAALERTLRLTDVQACAGTTGAGDASWRCPSHWLRGKCKVPESLWLRSILRGMGPSVVILGPEHLRQSYRRELDAFPLPDAL